MRRIMTMAAALSSVVAVCQAAETGPHTYSALGTRDQIAAERMAFALLDDPVVKAAQAKLRDQLLQYPHAHYDNAMERLDDAIRKWTVTVILREQAADPARPRILWELDDTPHTWFGFTSPGSSSGGDNPDHIYRTTFLDGTAQYEIKGRLSAKRPAQFSFEAIHNSPSLRQDKPIKEGPDAGNQIKMLTDRTLQVAPDGTFTIAVGGPQPATGNWLPTVPDTVEITMRDVFTDWGQRPDHLSIRRVGAPTKSAPFTQADVARLTAQDLSDYVRFWLDANIKWVSHVQLNEAMKPLPRDGGWGYLSGAHYKLAPGEAIVATLDPQGGQYTGLQVSDGWMITPDNRMHQPSLNNTQAVPNADGSITVVIATEDPGVTNWIDTAGAREGFVTIRWQGLPPGADGSKLLCSFAVMKLRDLLPGSGGPAVTPDQRRAQLAHRAATYANRLTD